MIPIFEILKDRTILKITGYDSLSFLQKLTTNDLRKKYSYNYILNNQGRYLFDFFVYQLSNDELYIDIAAISVETFIATLNKYKFRAKIEFEILANAKLLYSRDRVDSTEVISLQDPRFEKMGYRSIILHDIDKIGESASEIYLNDKYVHIIPDGAIDLIIEKSIPIDFGALYLNAIDYNKGCYIGQEVMSRIKYQGEIRKYLYGLECRQNFEYVTKNTKIYDGINEVGLFLSSFKNRALVIIRSNYITSLSKHLIIGEKSYEVNLIRPAWLNS